MSPSLKKTQLAQNSALSFSTALTESQCSRLKPFPLLLLLCSSFVFAKWSFLYCCEIPLSKVSTHRIPDGMRTTDFMKMCLFFFTLPLQVVYCTSPKFWKRESEHAMQKPCFDFENNNNKHTWLKAAHILKSKIFCKITE